MINSDDIKSRVNIVDIIGQFLNLKKNGSNYFACCPFHGEKTPSFSVAEDKQFFHCFGCGAQGDVFNFLMDYNGYEFMDAAKELAALIGMDIDELPRHENAERKLIKRYHWRTPPCHKEDPEICESMIKKAQIENVKGIDFLRLRQSYMLPIYTADSKLVNLKVFEGEQDYFVAGGLSYNGFTPIRKNESSNWIAVSQIKTAKELLAKYKSNIAICWSDSVMKYICKWNFGDFNFMPVITDSDDDYLCYELDWFYWSNGKLEKKDRIDK